MGERETKYLLSILHSKMIAYYFRKKSNRQDKTFPEIRIYELAAPSVGSEAREDGLSSIASDVRTMRTQLRRSDAGQTLGIKEVDDGIWLVSFMHYDLGYFDLEQKTLQPLDNPFGLRLSPMS